LERFKTEVIAKSTVNHARVTKVTTAHGTFETPAFMPVATRAFVNHMTPRDLTETGSQIILGGNTYHMLVNPGMDIIFAAGGMHKFMNWQGPMLTDSGGFQVFSLSQNKKICTIDENGAHFKHPINGKVIHLTPQTSIEAQKIIGADIIMAFDECTPEKGGIDAAIKAMDRTHRWLLESKAVHDASPNSAYDYPQALFGIIQGGSFRDLREKSAEFIVNADTDGIAIGGEIIGFDRQKTAEIIEWIRPILPEHKTRYTMGVGLGPQDLIDVVANGIDIFDCVAPTRNARHGALYAGKFIQENGWIKFEGHNNSDRLLIKKSIYAKDETPIMEDCTCTTCQQFTKAYLHFLFKQQGALYYQLACIHNVHVMQHACALMRMIIMPNE
jgi:queuine tRNA-ribosyltransferase